MSSHIRVTPATPLRTAGRDAIASQPRVGPTSRWAVLLLVLAMLAGWLALSAGVARADTPVNPSNAQIREALFVAGDLARLSDGTSGLRSVVLEKLLQQMYQDNPGLDPGSAESAISAMQSTVNGVADATLSSLSSNEQIELLLDTLNQGSFGTAGDDAVQEVAHAALEGAGAGLPNGDDVSTVDSLDTLSFAGFAPARVLADTFQLAQTSPDFATARNALWGTASGETLDMTEAQLLAVPANQANADVQSTVQQLNSGATASQILSDESSNVSAVNAQVSTAITDLGIASSGSETNAQQQQIATDALAQQTADNTANAATALDEVVIGSNSQSQAVQITESALTLTGGLIIAGATEGGAGGSQIVSGFTGLLTSSIPGLGSLLGESSGPSPEEQAIEQLSTQVENLRQEMLSNFNTIDTTLGTVLTQDAALTQQLTTTNADVESVAQGLAEQQVSIDQMQANMYSIAADTSNRNLEDELNFAIGYQQRAADGQPMDQSDFSAADSFFYTWATSSALDSIALGPSSYAFDPASVFTRMTSGYSLDTNTNYLSQAAAQFDGGTPLSSDQLPNPQEWAVAARAYSELLIENPARVTTGQLQRLQGIAHEGDLLKAAIDTAAQQTASTGTDSTLFNNLISNYQSDLTATENDINSIVTTFIADIPGYDGGQLTQAHPLRNSNGQPIDLTQSATQITSDYANFAPTSATPCGTVDTGTGWGTNGWPSLPSSQDLPLPTAPSASVNGLPATWAAVSAEYPQLQVYALADRLGLGSLTACWQTIAFDNEPTTTLNLSVGAYHPLATVTQHWVHLYYMINWRYTPEGGSPVDVATVENNIGKVLTEEDYSGGIISGNWDVTFGTDGALLECWNDTSASDPDMDGGLGQNTNLCSNAVPAAPEINGWAWPLSDLLNLDGTDSSSQTAVTQADNNQLKTLREDLAQTILTGTAGLPGQAAGPSLTTTSQLLTDAQNLTGARNLLESFTEFTFAPALQTDNQLRALTEGADQLPGLDELKALYQQAETAPPAAGVLTADIDANVPGQISALQTSLASHMVPTSTSGRAGSQAARAAHTLSVTSESAAADPSGIDNELIDATLYRLALTPAAIAGAPTASGVGSTGTPSSGGGSGPGSSGNSSPAPAPVAALKLLRAKLLASSFTAKKGTTLTYTLSTAGTITVTITKTVTGHRNGHACVRAGHGKSCQLVVRVRQSRSYGRAGKNTVRSLGRGLPKGTYTLTLAPQAAGAKPIVLHFRVH